MSRNLENAAESLGDWDPQPIIFDKWEQFSEDRLRLEAAVQAEDLTMDEANDILNQYREIYGIE